MSVEQLEASLVRSWYQPRLSLLTLILLPFSWLFACVVGLRRLAYKFHFLKQHKLSVPVIVVGNITVGGTGKTPVVIALAKLLTEQGFRVGVVSRGYGANVLSPTLVTQDSSAENVGDEPLLIFIRTGAAVMVGKDRVSSAKKLIEEHDCQVIISDDGLQHYALGRDIEIALVDEERRFGNQHLLPAGPLREPISRLEKVTQVLVTGGDAAIEETVLLQPDRMVQITQPERLVDLYEFKPKVVHAVAGIANPRRFFKTLRSMKLRFFEHAFSDHYLYKKEDLSFGEDAVIVMTEKDAVKCKEWADESFYFLSITAVLPQPFEAKLLELLPSVTSI